MKSERFAILFNEILPLYTAVHRWKDRNKQLSLPLFPCCVSLKVGSGGGRTF